jgi:hypothetical protein
MNLETVTSLNLELRVRNNLLRNVLVLEDRGSGAEAEAGVGVAAGVAQAEAPLQAEAEAMVMKVLTKLALWCDWIVLPRTLPRSRIGSGLTAAAGSWSSSPTFLDPPTKRGFSRVSTG